MKKIFTLFLVLCTINAWAHDFVVNGILYRTLADKTNEVKVTYGGSYTGTLVIPETVTYSGITYSVTSLGDEAFDGCSGLTSVTIPNSVTSIGNYVFWGCSGLTSVTIGNSVTSIGDGAFVSCTGLTSITIPNSVTSIGVYAFDGCSCLTSVTIPNSITSIGDGAFRYCSGLTSIEIPNSVTSIGSGAFCYTGIYNNESNWENGVLYISNCLINTKNDISGAYIIKEGTRLIADGAFYNCSGLTSVNVCAEVPPTLGTNTFYNVSTTIPVYVPCGSASAYQSVEGWNKFTNIQGALTEYSIAVGVNDSIMGTSQVDYNKCEGAQISATPNLGYHFVQWSDGNTDNPRTLELTQDTILTAEFAQSFSDQCGDNLYWSYDETTKTISITGSGKMYDYTVNTQPWLLFKEDIKEVTTSNTTTGIGTSAFEGCIRLTKVSLGSGMVNIAANAFAECKKLYDIYSYAEDPPTANESSFANYNAYLYIPCESQRYYKADMVFSKFYNQECISSDKVDTEAGAVVVEPSTNDVTITWPTDPKAGTYVIVIKQGDKVFCSLTFNADGQLLNIAFAPSRSGSHPVTYATSTGNGLRFTVTSLEESTTYGYDITTKDEKDNTLSTYTGEFTTKSNVSTSVSDIQSPITDCQKLIRDGQLIIVRDGVEYNAQGQIVKE